MNKVAVVTGGAGGIGQAVAQRLSEDHDLVILLDVNEQEGRRVADEISANGRSATFFAVDVTQESAVESCFARIVWAHQRIDVLVNVAGGSLHRHKFEEFPSAHWRAVLDANLTSTFLCCRSAVPVMKTQKSGVIINISSDLAYSGSEGRSAYAAAKAGVLGLTKTLALELAPFGVRVNALAPGRIATARVRANYSAQEWESANDRIPLGHPGQPQDVAEAVAFLAGNRASHITGQTIHINGGRIMT